MDRPDLTVVINWLMRIDQRQERMEQKLDDLTHSMVSIPACQQRHEESDQKLVDTEKRLADRIKAADKLTWKNATIFFGGIGILATGITQIGNLLSGLASVAKAFGGP